MAEEVKNPTFEDLYQRDIKKYVEKLKKEYTDKKTNQKKYFELSYLSWAYGHREMKRIDPGATEHVHEFPMMINGQVVVGVSVPYLWTPNGFFVQNTVTINGRSETEWLPVLDNSNRPIPNPNSFQINTSNKRCFVKALAKHGLGLYLYIGEDLPENISEDSQPSEKGDTNSKPYETKAKIASYEEKDRLMNKLREYVAIRGMDDEAGLTRMVGWVCKQTKAKSFDVLTSPQAFSATEKIDQLILAEFQKTDEPKAEQEGLDFTYPQADAK